MTKPVPDILWTWPPNRWGLLWSCSRTCWQRARHPQHRCSFPIRVAGFPHQILLRMMDPVSISQLSMRTGMPRTNNARRLLQYRKVDHLLESQSEWMQEFSRPQFPKLEGNRLGIGWSELVTKYNLQPIGSQVPERRDEQRDRQSEWRTSETNFAVYGSPGGREPRSF